MKSEIYGGTIYSKSESKSDNDRIIKLFKIGMVFFYAQNQILKCNY